ncbi:MAG TPA: HAMP domain-containing protein [Gammaproteobacteria bacterium]|nr:HAMP domain-containing protein [Gammaproteobacteria bacterium]
MSAATENSERFGRLYLTLLFINLLALIMLLVLISTNLVRLVRQYRNRAMGSRLTLRLVVLFVVIAMVPVSLVYYFSLQFIQRGIDSWFDVHIEQAFEDALALSRDSLDERKREYLRRTLAVVDELIPVDDAAAALLLDDLRARYEADELTLLTSIEHIIAFSSSDPTRLLPDLPGEAVLRQVQQGTNYIGVDALGERGLHMRVLVTVDGEGASSGRRMLSALYPLSPQVQRLANNVQNAYQRYQQLTYLRQPLKFSFILTLSLVLLMSLLFAVWAAFFSARRLVAPIRALAIGTRAVAGGDYHKRLPQYSGDELGGLVESFNDMTEKIARARDEVKRSQQAAESERAYLRAVLGRLSSGVLTLDRNGVIRTANPAVGHILGLDPESCVGRPLLEIGKDSRHLHGFVEAVAPRLEGAAEWRQEINLFGAAGRQVLMCRGTTLPGEGGEAAGHVIVVEDITTLVQAQRDAAWGEVARRLAHEIKNPLTPIRLSAERLRHKFLARMDPGDAEVLERATHTIVQQVEAMKEMVKAFSEYARTPRLELRRTDLNTLIGEVLELYRGHGEQIRFHTALAEGLPPVEVDNGRMRQLLHNLIKNSEEAAEGVLCHITIGTRLIHDGGLEMIELEVRDNGPGIPEEMMGRFFEPYVTTKPKGSGLGLAIVKKIVEEHGGIIWAENPEEGGAAIIIRLPLRNPQRNDAREGGGDMEKADTGRRRKRRKAG